MDFVDRGMPASTQWLKVPIAVSGSSTMSASCLAPFGTPFQASGGETPSPTQLNCTGMVPSSTNALLVSTNVGVDAAPAPVAESTTSAAVDTTTRRRRTGTMGRG